MDEKIRPTLREVFLGTVGWPHGGRVCQIMTRLGMMHKVFEIYEELKATIKDPQLRLLRSCTLAWEFYRERYNDEQLKCFLKKMK